MEGSYGSMPASTELTSGVGTALYIAPETVEARHIRAKHLEKIDIYSFGNSMCFLTKYDRQLCYRRLTIPFYQTARNCVV
jgi:serine/threonine protein kinase